MTPFLDHAEPEFSVSSAHGGLVAGERLQWHRQELEQRGFSRAQAEGITEALKNLDTSSFVTQSDLELDLTTQTVAIITWMTGILVAQGALIVALIQSFK